MNSIGAVYQSLILKGIFGEQEEFRESITCQDAYIKSSKRKMIPLSLDIFASPDSSESNPDGSFINNSRGDRQVFFVQLLNWADAAFNEFPWIELNRTLCRLWLRLFVGF